MTGYKKQYAEKKTTPAGIAGLIQSGWVCCADNGLSIPYSIFNAVGARIISSNLSDITMHALLELKPMPCYDESLKGKIKGVSWFSSGCSRKAINAGYGDIMPCYYRDMPSLFSEYVDIDAFCAVVSPMDKHGYFSTGNASNSAAMLRKAKRIFLEVNDNMPRTLSAPQIHISQVTALCENHLSLPTLDSVEIDEVSMQIGEIIAAEIPDGATIQLGIGSIPNAVGALLKNKHDLGIHSEMFTDSMVELLECGAANNSRKPIHTGKSVASFAYGSKHMYDYMDDNPALEMLPVDYVNDPSVIARHPNMISINAALEVDFLGQVCAESIGARVVSGTGGQVDFVRGAIQSEGGKSFIAFHSTAQNGTVSRISPILKPGAFVTTSKNDVDCIVTEYGIAKLRGRTLQQRTKALIEIAHPHFRYELICEAKKMNLLV